MTQPIQQPTEPTTAQPAQPTQPAQPSAPAAPIPPWERDGTPFDQARAWQLIQNKDSDNAQLKARVAELTQYETAAKAAEEANKTELQKAQEAAAKHEQDAKDARLALLRTQVANREGKVLPAGWAERLRGTTQAELEADADSMLASFPVAQGGATPLGALRPGALPQPPAPTLADAIAAAEKAGDVKTVMRLKTQQLFQQT